MHSLPLRVYEDLHTHVPPTCAEHTELAPVHVPVVPAVAVVQGPPTALAAAAQCKNTHTHTHTHTHTRTHTHIYTIK